MPITLELKAKHFKDTEFYDNECAIAKAFTELTGIKPLMGFSFVETPDMEYQFPWYGSDSFKEDKSMAENLNFDESVIRTIELVEDEKTVS